jgi:adhesin transport system outer membrane protein
MKRPIGIPVLLVAGLAPGTLSAQTSEGTLTILGAVDAALATHPAVLETVAGIDAARAAEDQARAAWFPSLTVSGNWTRFAEPMVVAPLHGFDPMSPPDFDPSLVQGRAGLDYMIFDGGARGARIGAGAARVNSSSAQARQARQGVIRTTVEAYLDVVTSDAILASAERQIVAFRAERDRVGRFLAEGAAAQVELLRAEAALSRSEANRLAAEASRDAALRTLARLMGSSGEGADRRALSSVDARSRSQSREGASTNVVGSPAVASARARADVSRANLRAARASLFPSIRLTSAYNQFGGADTDFTGEWQAGLAVRYPVFTGGATRGRIREREAEVRAADQAAARVQLELETAVDRLTATLDAAWARAESLGAAEAQFEEVARIEELALEEGAGVQRDFLAAQASLFDVRAELARARADIVRTLVRRAETTGVLDREWLTENLEVEP